MTETRENIKWLEVNCIGLKCPLPVMRLEKALLAGHSHIQIITDDPISVIDIPLACAQNNANLLEKVENENFYQFFVENLLEK